jgi:hypothetical protein
MDIVADVYDAEEQAARWFNCLAEIPKYLPLNSVESDWKLGGEVLSFPNTYSYRYWSDNYGTEKSEENYITISYCLDK